MFQTLVDWNWNEVFPWCFLGKSKFEIGLRAGPDQRGSLRLGSGEYLPQSHVSELSPRWDPADAQQTRHAPDLSQRILGDGHGFGIQPAYSTGA